jgi:hypothetical protein
VPVCLASYVSKQNTLYIIKKIHNRLRFGTSARGSKYLDIGHLRDGHRGPAFLLRASFHPWKRKCFYFSWRDLSLSLRPLGEPMRRRPALVLSWAHGTESDGGSGFHFSTAHALHFPRCARSVKISRRVESLFGCDNGALLVLQRTCASRQQLNLDFTID